MQKTLLSEGLLQNRSPENQSSERTQRTTPGMQNSTLEPNYGERNIKFFRHPPRYPPRVSFFRKVILHAIGMTAIVKKERLSLRSFCRAAKRLPQHTGNFQPCPLLGFDFRCTQIGTLDILDLCMVCSVLTSHLPTSLSSFRFASKPPLGLSSKRRRFHWTLLHVFVVPHVSWCFADPFSGIESRIVSLP